MSIWNEAAWFASASGLALKSTIVLGVAWLLAFAMRRKSAAARHLVWTAAAASLLGLPWLSIALPAVRVPRAAGLLPMSSQLTFQTTVFESRSFMPQTAPSNIPVAPRATPSSIFLARAHWKVWLMLLWAGGATFSFAHMLAACAALWRVRRSARPAADRDLSLCSALARALGIQRRVEVLETKTGSMPMTFGILRSAILVPSDAARWDGERRRIVFLHELAHVLRGDVATNLLARVALALYWWNPLTWKAWREFLKERERATDDLVLNSGASAAEYAGHLLAVARAMQCPPSVGWAAIAMARPSQLEGRLAAILDSGIRRKTLGRGSALIAASVAMVVMAPLAALRAQNGPSNARVPADVDSATTSALPKKNPPIEATVKAAEQHRKYDNYWVSVGGKLNTQEKEQRLKDALAADGPFGDLPLAVEIDRFRVGSATYFLSMSVAIPGSIVELAANAGATETELDLIGQVKDEAQAVVSTVQDKLVLKVDPGSVEKAGQNGIQYDASFTLPPGKYSLKLLARENITGKMGTFEQRFVVPDLSAESSELKLSTIVFGNQRAHLRGATAADPHLAANPLVVGGEKIIPSITKLFRQQQTMHVSFDVYDALPDPDNPQARRIQVSFSLIDENGATAFETTPAMATQLAQTRPEAVPVTIDIPLQNIAPGRYTCHLNIVDEAGRKSASIKKALTVTP